MLQLPIATQNRRFSRSRFLVFLGLAISIFAWGLQYKLSLYEPSTAIHPQPQVPKAKLLSHDEHFRTAESIRALVSKPVTPITSQISFLAALLLLEPAVPRGCYRARAVEALLVEPSPLMSGLFVRPPPYPA